MGFAARKSRNKNINRCSHQRNNESSGLKAYNNSGGTIIPVTLLPKGNTTGDTTDEAQPSAQRVMTEPVTMTDTSSHHDLNDQVAASSLPLACQ
eukprot:4863850-Pyramimonas_sp.AAC.1